MYYIWSWWRHAGGQILEISENYFHFWILRPIFTLGASFHVHVIFISGEVGPFTPIFGLDGIMRWVKNWHLCPFFQNSDPIFEFLGVLSINLQIFVEKDGINARETILCIFIFRWKTKEILIFSYTKRFYFEERLNILTCGFLQIFIIFEDLSINQ